MKEKWYEMARSPLLPKQYVELRCVIVSVCLFLCVSANEPILFSNLLETWYGHHAKWLCERMRWGTTLVKPNVGVLKCFAVTGIRRIAVMLRDVN
jgi:hypothetical protein